MIWNTLICIVILGTSDATRNIVLTILLNLNLKRFMIYAVMVPKITVITTETPTTRIVFRNALNISPLTKAVTKLSKFNQLFGGARTLVDVNSSFVLKAPNTTTTSGTSVINAVKASTRYFKT